jgi:two-component system C4-dicarboxylate transport response regulator DctD
MIETAPSQLVALVEDDEDLRVATEQLLTLNGFTVRSFARAPAALAAIGADFPGIVVTDVRMPGMSGIELFRALRERDADLPVVLMTGHGDVQMAVAALKAGAWDFLTKPFDAEMLLAAAARACSARALVLENRRLRALAEAKAADELIGETPAIRRLRAMIPTLAETSLDFVIEGETGTGKELYARLVHRSGRRARHRFVVIDCATIPPAVVGGELFARGGVVARASRGTLFLDNVQAASLDLQHRLAQLAETRAVALDAREPDPVDIRIIGSIVEGSRAAILPALFHRLAGVPLRMPPLAERREDIPLLFAHFLASAAERFRRPAPPLPDDVHRMASRDWPGNVRELEKAAERLCLGLEGEEAPGAFLGPASLPARVDAFEKTLIVDAVTAAGGEIAAAIESLHIPRKTFYYRVKRLGIDLRALRNRAAGKG